MSVKGFLLRLALILPLFCSFPVHAGDIQDEVPAPSGIVP